MARSGKTVVEVGMAFRSVRVYSGRMVNNPEYSREGNMDIRLSAIHLYPVKGIRGVSANQARVEKIGLQSDRRWVVVGGDGNDRDPSRRPVP